MTTTKTTECICGVFFPAHVAPYKTQAAAKAQATIQNKAWKDVVYRAASLPDADGAWGLERAQNVCSCCWEVNEASRLNRIFNSVHTTKMDVIKKAMAKDIIIEWNAIGNLRSVTFTSTTHLDSESPYNRDGSVTYQCLPWETEEEFVGTLAFVVENFWVPNDDF